MVFSSFDFLIIFLPLFLISYFFVENKFKNLCILLFSLVFYAYGCFDNISYFFILIASLFLNHRFGIWMGKGIKHKKFVLILSLIFNFGMLFVFKYFDFFIDIITIITKNQPINKLNLVLPIGISFYTFQIVSYLIDVYFEKIPYEKSFIDFGTYVVMFPQLIAGPILRYSDIMAQIKSDRDFKWENFKNGLTIFIIGLASKVIIANQLSMVDLDVRNFGLENMCRLTAWGTAIAWSMQMYFDFYGYSLMSIGLGKMMGFDIMENFKDPFLSKSITEYWRRWHISLSTWFKDYLLYPILLSKGIKSLRNSLNTSVGIKVSNVIVNIIATFFVWLATGLWHGANFNFIIWGMYFFVLLTIEQIFLYKILNKSKIISHIYLCVLIAISFVIFFNEDLNSICLIFNKMFGLDVELINNFFDKTIMNNWKAILLGVLCVIKIPQFIYKKIENVKAIKFFIILILLAISLTLIYIGYNDPFMYFRF